eukprot:SAG11_NODE_5617_length_1506_cov_20.295665_2_plen_191_part_00
MDPGLQVASPLPFASRGALSSSLALFVDLCRSLPLSMPSFSLSLFLSLSHALLSIHHPHHQFPSRSTPLSLSLSLSSSLPTCLLPRTLCHSACLALSVTLLPSFPPAPRPGPRAAAPACLLRPIFSSTAAPSSARCVRPATTSSRYCPPPSPPRRTTGRVRAHCAHSVLVHSVRYVLTHTLCAKCCLQTG